MLQLIQSFSPLRQPCSQVVKRHEAIHEEVGEASPVTGHVI